MSTGVESPMFRLVGFSAGRWNFKQEPTDGTAPKGGQCWHCKRPLGKAPLSFVMGVFGAEPERVRIRIHARCEGSQ